MRPENTEQFTEHVNQLERARWITADQLRSIEDLVHSEGGSAIVRPQNGEEEPYGPTIYTIGEEPLMVFNKVSKRDSRLVGWVFPSEKHARMLQKAGILHLEETKGKK